MKAVLPLALVLGVVGVAQAAPLKVAVIPGIAVNMDASRVDALSQDLALALSSELEVDAIGGLEVRRKLPAEGLPPECVTTPSCVSDVAKRTGAQQLLFVVMVDSGAGGSIQVDTTWIEPASGHSASRPAIDLTSLNDVHSQFAAVARPLLPDAKAREKGGIGQKLTESEGTPRHVTTLSLAVAGVGVVGLGVGLGVGLSTRSAYNTCNGSPNACDQSQRDSIRTKGVIADIGWIAGVGGLVAFGIMYATSAEAPHIMVQPTGGGVSAAYVGRF
jgi:hypothetical protein